jgi:hypothetical protein
MTVRVAFTDLFDRIGDADVGYSARAAKLSGVEVVVRGYLVKPHADAAQWMLVDAPGACPDCAPAPVPAIQLPGFSTGPRVSDGATAVRLRGRLSFGFEIDAAGNASFLRLVDARPDTHLPARRTAA